MKHILRFLLGLTLCSPLTHAQSALRNPTIGMWNDAEFVKSFTASYGVLAGYEPEISAAEKDSLRGLFNTIKNNPAAAIAALEQPINSNRSAAFDFILANLHFQEDDLNKAEKSYREAIRKYPNFRRAYKNLGYVLIQNNQYKAAIPVISKAMELGTVDGRSYGLLGYSYMTEAMYYPAEAAYRQAILMQPEERDWKLGLARCLVETQDYAAAITLFDTLIKQTPDNADFWLLQANAYLGQEESLAAAQNIEVVRRMGQAPVNSLTTLGDIYMRNNDPELALSAYLEALKKSDHTNSQALMRASKLFTQTGNYPEAKTLIAQLRQQSGTHLGDEDDLSLLTLEAKIARASGDDEAALASLTQIVERDALNGEALIELGNYYADRDEMERAINRYEQAQAIGQYERPALIAHAQALIRKKKYQEALVLLNHALDLETDEYLAEYVKRVESAIN